MEARFGLRVANVFHAGDGNLHPLILYDANEPGELERAEAFGADILRLCVEVGGVLTGEHGVGVEKRDLMGTMFNEIDLDQQQRLKCAFDPDGLLNPGKVFPQLCRCAELGRVHVHRGKVALSRPAALLRRATRVRVATADAAEVAEVVAWAAAEASRSRSSAAAPSARSAARCRPSTCSTSRGSQASSTTSRPNWC